MTVQSSPHARKAVTCVDRNADARKRPQQGCTTCLASWDRDKPRQLSLARSLVRYYISRRLLGSERMFHRHFRRMYLLMNPDGGLQIVHYGASIYSGDVPPGRALLLQVLSVLYSPLLISAGTSTPKIQTTSGLSRRHPSQRFAAAGAVVDHVYACGCVETIPPDDPSWLPSIPSKSISASHQSSASAASSGGPHEADLEGFVHAWRRKNTKAQTTQEKSMTRPPVQGSLPPADWWITPKFEVEPSPMLTHRWKSCSLCTRPLPGLVRWLVFVESAALARSAYVARDRIRLVCVRDGGGGGGGGSGPLVCSLDSVRPGTHLHP